MLCGCYQLTQNCCNTRSRRQEYNPADKKQKSTDNCLDIGPSEFSKENQTQQNPTYHETENEVDYLFAGTSFFCDWCDFV